MGKIRHSIVWLLVMAMFCANRLPVAAAQPDPLMLDSQVVVTAPLVPTDTPYKLVVQATSLPHVPYYYILTITNITPWSIEALQVRDRYLNPEPDIPELTRLWLPGELLPGESIAITLIYDEGAIEGGCHQLEISLADGLFTILMDCSTAGSTTVWEVPLTADMEAYLALPPLTQVTASGRSKAGLHVARNADPAVMAFIKAAQPAVVVSVDDLDWLREVKQVSPSTVTIGRFMEDDQALTGDPLERAQEFVADNAAQYRANPGVDYWLGWNEPAINTPEEMAWYAAFEAERVRLMDELGLKAAIGNFSTGTPEADEFEAFLPAVAAAKRYGGILALHEYSAPTLRDGVNAAIPGAADIDGAGALTLRYRYWYDHYLRPQDLVIPLVITEAGIDGGVLGTGAEGKGGWRDWLDEGALGESTPAAAADYLGQLSWYDDELRRDPYVLGFAIFNAGTPSGQWASFDITELLPQLAGMVNSKG
ncbi:MAG: hypothetical protein LLG44_14630 [Chloroflexi bacterium]|nr:hypothetical protein [Chloroflexota bacterium]